jgi:hypothetical protein
MQQDFVSDVSRGFAELLAQNQGGIRLIVTEARICRLRQLAGIWKAALR